LDAVVRKIRIIFGNDLFWIEDEYEYDRMGGLKEFIESGVVSNAEISSKNK